MSNGSATSVSATGVVLSGSFSGASSTPLEIGYYWGTSSTEMTNRVVASVSGSTSGSFTASISGLTEGQNYVCRAYAIVKGSGSFAAEEETFYASGSPLLFQTTSSGGTTGPAVNEDWLELTSGREGSRYIVKTYSVGGERNYTHLYDTEMKGSLWTAYPLNSSHTSGSGRGSWSYNPYIPQKYQNTGVSGYSRGHMLPNASRNGNKEMQKQAFYYTNQVPQLQDQFNGSIWALLEGGVRGLVNESEEIYVVTGVAYQTVGGNETIKKSDGVPIPNFFYKVVLRVKCSGNVVTSAQTCGFWFEHKNYSKGDDYTNYSVSVDFVEQKTGFDFFVNLPDNIENAVETNSSWSRLSSF